MSIVQLNLELTNFFSHRSQKLKAPCISSIDITWEQKFAKEILVS